MRPVYFPAFRMVFKRPDAAAVWRTQHHGNSVSSPGTPAQSGGMVFDLVKVLIAKSGELNFADRLEPIDRHADGHADNRRLGQRSVQYALIAELVDQAVGDPEHTAVNPNVFAQNNNTVIFFHFLLQRQIEGLDHRHFSHVCPPQRVRPALWPIGLFVLSDTAAFRHRHAQTCPLDCRVFPSVFPHDPQQPEFCPKLRIRRP